MLLQLTLQDYTIVSTIAIDCSPGMTVITGESGAGKSLIIDGLSLCLGGRAETAGISSHATSAQLSACFSLQKNPAASTWLANAQLAKGDRCTLQRILYRDGRSRNFINDVPRPLTQLRELGQLLVQLHTQQRYQQLFKEMYQRQLLDHFAAHPHLLRTLQEAHQRWITTQQKFQQLQQKIQHDQQQREWLAHQLTILSAAAPQVDEYQQLNVEQQQLATYHERLRLSQQAQQLFLDHEALNICSVLQQVIQPVDKLLQLDNRLCEVSQLLHTAHIQIQEAHSALRHYSDHLEADPHRLQYVEQRLAQLVELARKYRIAPNNLATLQQQLQSEWESLEQQTVNVQQLQQACDTAHAAALAAAHAVTASRKAAAQQLAQQVTQQLHTLCMPYSHFAVQIEKSDLTCFGQDMVQFFISTNPGQPTHPVTKVASGGELARIALAIELVTAHRIQRPTLIFDEIDTGVSGQSAVAIGKALRRLGKRTQLLCITHAPQVAGCGHHHLCVRKYSHPTHSRIEVCILNRTQRLQELARLLGGETITHHTLANAHELLAID